MRSLVSETSVGLLLFDEPSASLDPTAEHGDNIYCHSLFTSSHRPYIQISLKDSVNYEEVKLCYFLHIVLAILRVTPMSYCACMFTPADMKLLTLHQGS